jgi:DNA-directed RNA polymerase specialized sigma24 family protein
VTTSPSEEISRDTSPPVHSALAAAFKRLPLRQRRALYMVAVEGLAYRDAAARLEVGVPEILELLFSAHEELRHAVGMPNGEDATARR